MTVLIIEDDDFSAKMIAEMVRPFTSQPHIAHSMLAATRFILESGERPAIITVDLTLPDSDRRQTIEYKLGEIRNHAPDALIIVLTGLIQADEIAKCRENGADVVWEKLEVATPNAFMTQLKALVLEIMQHPTSLKTRLRVIEAVSSCIARVAGGTDVTQPRTLHESEAGI